MAYSPNGINSNGITIQLAATNLLGQGYVTNLSVANELAITGSSTTKSVAAPLASNAVYSVTILVTDESGNRATNTLSFDTINPAFTFEAEDFDYNGGAYFSNPQPDSYAGLTGFAGIDYSNGIIGQGSASYRPQGLETEGAGDTPRLAYGSGLSDYDVGFANKGNWGNYTRSLPAGTYYLFMRAASPNGPISDIASMYLVTSGFDSVNQTTVKLGTYSVPNTGGWQTYTWLPLNTNSTTLATVTGGTVETLRATTDNTGYNVNFYMLIATNIQPPWLVSPITLPGSVPLTTTPPTSGQFALSWPTNINPQIKLYYTPVLGPEATWTPLTNAPLLSNNQWIVLLPVGSNSSGFYRLQ
jgi:hypothetical protein